MDFRKTETVDSAMLRFSDQQVVAERGPKNVLPVDRPYHQLVEAERAADGRQVDVATIFLTNRECPFRCLMCDLWQNTTDHTVPDRAIPAQIRFGLQQLPDAQHIKLYNSGNFFDPKAIPLSDHAEIAGLVKPFENVIVENHPRLCGDRCLRFRDQCGTQLEVAVGLETAHEPTLQMLNKQMTIDDFSDACQFLTGHGIRVRTFILLKPPLTSEAEGIDRAIDSIRFAFDCGVDCCALIPTRPGNGLLDQLQKQGQFQPPSLRSLEHVVEQTIGWNRGRVFADLWDGHRFAECDRCAAARVDRLHRMNLQQVVLPSVLCDACAAKSKAADL